MVEKKAEQRYGPTSGTFAGWVGVVLCVVLAVLLAISDPDVVSLRWILGLLAAAGLIASMMLRPVIVLRPGRLVLRNPFSTWLVPLAAIEAVEVRAVTRVSAGGATYDAVAVGRRIRKMVRGVQPSRITDLSGYAGGRIEQPAESSSRKIDASTPEALADLMIGQILAAADDARSKHEEAGQVQRVWSVVPIGVIVALTVGFVVALFL
ncbi:MAG: hypothetical protein ACJ72E_12990 [Marmoricola sp.]